MIEEIKNEIIDLTPLFGNKEGVCVLRKEVFEILDKYKDKEIKFEDGSSKFAIVKVPKLNVDNIKNYNQPDYKSAFEELKQYNIDLDKTNAETLVKDNSEFYHYQRGFMMGTKNQIIKTKELEQKYKLGGE